MREGQLTQLWDFISGNSRTAAQLPLCCARPPIESPAAAVVAAVGEHRAHLFSLHWRFLSVLRSNPDAFLIATQLRFFFPPEIYHSGFSVTGMWNIYLEGRMTLKLKTECLLQTPRGQLPPPPSPLSITQWAAPCRTGKPGEALKEHTHTGPFLVF